MYGMVKIWLTLLLAFHLAQAQGQAASGVVDIPTRPGVTQRMLVLPAPDPKAAVILFAGGHGGLQISPHGALKWGENNFLVRTRQLFADQGLLVIVVDTPSDRQSEPFLSGFRQVPEHVEDIKAVIAWVRGQAPVPVWLVGTSRGTQSAAYVATQLAGQEGPDGMVLTATILTDKKSRPVPTMPLDKLRIPVLVVHHEQDGCSHCSFNGIPALMDKLGNAPRKQLLSFTGGENRGDPCAAMAYHGFNGLERDVVAQIAAWIVAR
ncbi:MAG: CocE/NonD family hydrolase [Rhodocyclaceae bacterium]|nr:CocE/NonD family hydrolase [Rhodocyclaceae bacterium]